MQIKPDEDHESMASLNAEMYMVTNCDFVDMKVLKRMQKFQKAIQDETVRVCCLSEDFKQSV